MIRRWRQHGLWLGLLAGHCYLWLWATPYSLYRRDTPVFGSFHRVVYAHLWAAEGTWATVQFTGETPPTWHWQRPTTAPVTDLNLTWDGRHLPSPQQGTLHLPNMTLTHAGAELPLDQAWLTELFQAPQAAIAMHDLLLALRDDALPTRRNSYNYEGPVHGDLAHFSRERRYAYAFPLWALLTGGLVLCWRFTHSARKQTQADLHPLRLSHSDP